MHNLHTYIPKSESISIPHDKLVTKAKSGNSPLFHSGKTEEISSRKPTDGTAPDSSRFNNHVLPKKPMEINLQYSSQTPTTEIQVYTFVLSKTKRWASQTSQISIKNKESKFRLPCEIQSLFISRKSKGYFPNCT